MKLKQLPNTEYYYILTCVGVISTTVAKSTSNIEVSFLQINKSNGFDKLSESDLGEPIKIPVDIGLLNILRVGSIWHNKRCIQLAQANSPSITIKIKSPHLLKTKAFTDFFPDKVHKAILKNSILYKLPCFNIDKEDFELVAGDNNFDKIIIPCIEVFRNTFGKSSNIIKKVFHGGLANNKIFDPNKSALKINPITDEKIASVWLKKGIHEIDVLHVAYLFVSKAARDSSNSLFTSILNKRERNMNVLPECSMPIEGEYKINISGKIIEFDDLKYFYVYNINISGFNYGFDSYENGSDIDFRKVEGVDRKKLKLVAKKRSVNRISPGSEIKLIDGEAEADSSFIPIDLENDNEVSFGNLPQNLGKIPKEEQKYRSENTIRNKDANIGTTVNSGSSGNNTGIVEVNIFSSLSDFIDNESVDDSFQKFYQSIVCLNSYELTNNSQGKILDVSFYGVNSNHGKYSIFRSERKRNWCLLKSDDGINYYNRRIILAQIVGIIEGKEHFFYFMDIEPDKSGKRYSIYLFNKTNFSKILSNEFIPIIKKCGQECGVSEWYTDPLINETIHVRTLNHSLKSNAIKDAKRFREEMKNIYMDQRKISRT